MKRQRGRSKEQKEKNRKDKKDKNKGLVVIPYVQGVSEPLERIFKKYNISTAMRPHLNLRKLLVHPKDKRDMDDNAGVVYSIPCTDCTQVYVGETGRQFGTRKQEHQKEAEEVGTVHYTRATRKDSVSTFHKSAISDHVAQENHTIDWGGAKILAKEGEKIKRKITESIHIRKKDPLTMNRDEGAFSLPNVYNTIIRDPPCRREQEATSF